MQLNEVSKVEDLQPLMGAKVVFIEEENQDDMGHRYIERKITLEKNGQIQVLSICTDGILLHGMEG